MRYAPEFHMPVMLLNHGNTVAQMPGKGIVGHPVGDNRHGGVVVAQAAHRPLLVVVSVVQ